MFLELKRVFVTEGSSVTFGYSIDLSSYEAEEGEFPFKDPISIKGKVQNTAGVVELSAVAEYNYYTSCDRCCGPVVEHMLLPFRNILVTSVENRDIENDELMLVENERIDLDDLAVSNIILNLPMKHLCREDCRGLCPQCGKNLNEGSCGCSDETDSRLSALKNLL